MTTSIDRATASTALSLITQVSVEAWRVITADESGYSRSEEVELQPQPLPPVARFQVAAALMAQRFARLAIESEIQGRAASQIINDLVDDWCGTPPWPHNWPHPGPGRSPDPGPRPNEVTDRWLSQTGRMVGALVLASIGSRLSNGELSNAMLDGAQRLAEAAVAP